MTIVTEILFSWWLIWSCIALGWIAMSLDRISRK